MSWNFYNLMTWKQTMGMMNGKVNIVWSTEFRCFLCFQMWPIPDSTNQNPWNFSHEIYEILNALRSCHQSCSVKNCVLKKFSNFTGKHLCWSLFSACNFVKKKLQYRSFPVKLARILRTPILKNICERLLRHLFRRIPEYSSFGDSIHLFDLQSLHKIWSLGLFVNTSISLLHLLNKFLVKTSLFVWWIFIVTLLVVTPNTN